MTDLSNSRQRSPTQGDPKEPNARPASVEKIETVSGLLAAKKSVLDWHASPAKIELPRMSRSVVDAIRGLKNPANSKSRGEDHTILLDPTRVELPEGGHAERSKDEQPPEAEPRSGDPRDDHHPTLVGTSIAPNRTALEIPSTPVPARGSATFVAPNSSGKEGPPATSLVAGVDGSKRGGSGASNRPEESTVPRRLQPPTSIISVAIGGSFDPGRPGDILPRPDEGSSSAFARQSDSIGVGRDWRSQDSWRADVSSTVASVGLPRDGEDLRTSAGSPNFAGVRGHFDGGSRSRPSAGSSYISPGQVEPGRVFVRNPLSSELRDFSMASPTPAGKGDSSSDGGDAGESRLDRAAGGSSSPQAETSGDLSKTNELLGQLIDAFRKQRGSSLPPGGPSVYPDR
jgi:hypothetical protein